MAKRGWWVARTENGDYYYLSDSLIKANKNAGVLFYETEWHALHGPRLTPGEGPIKLEGLRFVWEEGR